MVIGKMGKSQGLWGLNSISAASGCDRAECSSGMWLLDGGKLVKTCPGSARPAAVVSLGW